MKYCLFALFFFSFFHVDAIAIKKKSSHVKIKLIDLTNKTFEFTPANPSPNPETQMRGFVTFLKNNKATILPGGDMVLNATYSVDKKKMILIKAEMGSFTQKFKIKDAVSLEDEYHNIWVLKK